MSCQSCQYLSERITKLKEILEKYEDAIIAVTGGVQSYTLDTGQTRQTVTRANLDELKNGYDSMFNSLLMLQNRFCNQCGPGGGGTTIVRPIW